MELRLFTALCLLWLVSCQSPTKESTSSNVELPVGNQIPFDDTPGIVKAELKNAGGIDDGIGYYENGKKSGSWVEYDNSSMLKRVTTYLNGKKEGITVEFSNNQLIRRYYFHNDLRHGEYVEYSGVIVKEVRNYVSGKMEGPTRVYYDDGKIQEEGNYLHGVRDGTSKWYDQAGSMTIMYEYKNGVLLQK